MCGYMFVAVLTCIECMYMESECMQCVHVMYHVYEYVYGGAYFSYSDTQHLGAFFPGSESKVTGPVVATHKAFSCFPETLLKSS